MHPPKDMREQQPENRLRYQKIGKLPIAGQYARSEQTLLDRWTSKYSQDFS